MRAVAADADAQRSRRAALPLRLPDGVQKALAHAFQIAVGAAQMIELQGREYWMFLFSQPPPLRISLTSISSSSHCSKWIDRRFRAEIIAAVLAGERIDGIRPQLAAPRRFGDGFLNRFADAI